MSRHRKKFQRKVDNKKKYFPLKEMNVEVVFFEKCHDDLFVNSKLNLKVMNFRPNFAQRFQGGLYVLVLPLFFFFFLKVGGI